MASTLESSSPADVEQLDRRSRIYAIRVPSRLQQQIEAVAARDANTVSSVIRRLISIGLRQELESGGR